MGKKSKQSDRSAGSDAGKEKKRKKVHESPLIQQHEPTDRNNANQSSSKPRKHKHKREKSKKVLKEEEEERQLTALLFGKKMDVLDEQDDYNQEKQQSTPSDEAEEDAGLMFEIDRTGVDDPVELAESTEPTILKNDKADKQKSQDEKQIDDSDDESDNDDDETGDSDDDGPAWIDEDDEDLQVDLLETNRLRKLRKTRDETQPLRGDDLQKRLRNRYKSTMAATAQTQWARLDDDDKQEEPDKQQQNDDDDDQDDTDIQLSSQPLLQHGASSSTKRLAPNILSVVRCPDANQSDYNKAVVQAVHFHPGSDPDQPLLLTAGLDKTLRFFQVTAEGSEKVHGIHFPKLPIYSAAFLGDTGKVVVSGRRPFFYIYDSIAGKLDYIPKIAGRQERSLETCVASPDGKLIAFGGNDGYVILVDVHSKQWLANLKLNGSVRAIAFTQPNGDYLLASGSDGDVYRWDVKTRQCVERFENQDGTITSFLATSTRQHLAVGAESGVVNLYADHVRQRQLATSTTTITDGREPIKAIMNLQTSADMVRFNHDGQIMAMSSRREKNALKLLHVPTATVFSNWPTSKTPLSYVWSTDFSPQSKFLAMGNDKGKCLLYSLQHYNS
ncbi:RNA-associated protein 18 homolog [Seminavis robusta]|uniref:RNA-associated protein 18 homolog n=1 Tax=Seminavis robusta TaxID=568900 RepID=A0A9N8EUR1_9STRA|nr:RNA-associated protein 18 homolog [Seminavis robusta]|eukprot:Sro1677_g290580.1 RNA-associated protein 18 homolog (613) ;mRNA; r:12759-14688